MTSLVDHIVVAARTLDEGVAWCEATLGITPGAGGTHALMGTHNRLFSIACEAYPNAYFEIVAIDANAPPPGRARWFGLDTLDLSRGPRLVAFAARVPDIDAALARLHTAGCDAGRALAASRETPQGLLRWRIAVRDDGAVLLGGALPTLIEWGERHPAASMAPSRVTLRAVVRRGLPAAVADALPCEGVRCDAAPGAALEVQLDTPLGAVTLASA